MNDCILEQLKEKLIKEINDKEWQKLIDYAIKKQNDEHLQALHAIFIMMIKCTL